MKYLDLTLPSAAENLALEEALLEQCDAGTGPEVLRIWEPREWFVVLGYANRLATEVDVPACDSAGIPILRRSSGGGTVVQGPGILCYAVVLRTATDPALESITGANRYVLGRVAGAVSGSLGKEVRIQGDTDLTVGDRKFAGNAQRRKRQALLFHGSLLLDADLDRIRSLLPLPSRQPAYRAGRAHADFLVNLDLPAGAIRKALGDVWKTSGPMPSWPVARTTELVATKYRDEQWNRRW